MLILAIYSWIWLQRQGKTNIKLNNWTQFSSVQLLSHVRLFVTPWIAARQASLPSPTPGVYPNPCPSSDDSQPSHPLSSPLLLPPILPSIRVFSNESTLHMRWPKYWSFSFNISPSNEHPGLIFFRMDWLDLLVDQGTLKSLLQHHSSKVSILWHSAFFTIQLSHPYMTTGKTITLITGLHWSKNCAIKETIKKTEGSLLNGRIYLQIIYLIKDYCPKYIKNSCCC